MKPMRFFYVNAYGRFLSNPFLVRKNVSSESDRILEFRNNILPYPDFLTSNFTGFFIYEPG